MELPIPNRDQFIAIVLGIVLFMVIGFTLTAKGTAYAQEITWKPKPLPAVTITLPFPENYDLDKLAKAVSVAETSGCKDGTARSRNNCFGIMTWKNGYREPRWFKSQDDSFVAFKDIWKRLYGKFPDRALAVKWTGNDSADNWLKTVCTVYPHASCSTL